MGPEPLPNLSEYACLRCKGHKKRCDRVRPVCARCLRTGAQCEYKATVTAPPSLAVTPTPSLEDKSVLVQLVDAMVLEVGTDPPLSSTAGQQLTDTHLLTSIHHFALVSQLFAQKSGADHRLLLLNPRELLDAFFSPATHPALRWSLCATAVLLLSPESDKTALLEYYKRARKAVSRGLDAPSVNLIPALFFLASISTATGQTAFSASLARCAVHVVYALNMDVDPDEFTNMTLQEKEDQRKWYWLVAYWTKLYYLMGTSETSHRLHLDRVQLPKNSTGLFPELIRIYDVMEGIKATYTQPPSSIQELLTSNAFVNLSGQLITLFIEIPFQQLLIPNHTLQLPELFALYTQQFHSAPFAVKASLVVNTLNYFTAQSMLHRPKLTLMILTTPTSPLLQQSPHLLHDFITSLDKCLSSARHTSNITRYLLLATINPPEHLHPTLTNLTTECGTAIPKMFPASLYAWALALNILESAAVLYILTTRLPQVWTAGIAGLPPRAALLRDMRALVTFLGLLEDTHPGTTYLPPLGAVVRGMHVEMEAGEGAAAAAGLGGVEVGMRVLALDEAEERLRVVKEAATPAAFLGLLGLEVLGSVRWKGEGEEEWRRFWDMVKESRLI
ncbi:hypothetical protein BC830DRAFT_1105720 [Chytriomyces sp. MP71]|nr:hypothetical protein BC830DRAFT_1105720 [Chytriomyces sp. MP71]